MLEMKTIPLCSFFVVDEEQFKCFPFILISLRKRTHAHIFIIHVHGNNINFLGKKQKKNTNDVSTQQAGN